jgi:hypothetical protein
MTGTELHADTVDAWEGQPGVALASNPNRGTTRHGRPFRLTIGIPLAKGERHGMPALHKDWRTDRIGTEARLRAISDQLLAVAAATRARVAAIKLDDEGE